MLRRRTRQLPERDRCVQYKRNLAVILASVKEERVEARVRSEPFPPTLCSLALCVEQLALPWVEEAPFDAGVGVDARSRKKAALAHSSMRAGSTVAIRFFAIHGRFGHHTPNGSAIKLVPRIPARRAAGVSQPPIDRGDIQRGDGVPRWTVSQARAGRHPAALFPRVPADGRGIEDDVGPAMATRRAASGYTGQRSGFPAGRERLACAKPRSPA